MAANGTEWMTWIMLYCIYPVTENMSPFGTVSTHRVSPSAFECDVQRTIMVFLQQCMMRMMLSGGFVVLKKKTSVLLVVAGGGSEVAARALSVPDLKEAAAPAEGLELQERSTMEREISQIDQMIDDMEMKVSVLRWMVEARGPLFAEPISPTGSASLALLSVDEELGEPQPLCQRNHLIALVVVVAVVLVAGSLSVYFIF